MSRLRASASLSKEREVERRHCQYSSNISSSIYDSAHHSPGLPLPPLLHCLGLPLALGLVELDGHPAELLPAHAALGAAAAAGRGGGRAAAAVDGGPVAAAGAAAAAAVLVVGLVGGRLKHSPLSISSSNGK